MLESDKIMGNIARQLMDRWKQNQMGWETSEGEMSR